MKKNEELELEEEREAAGDSEPTEEATGDDAPEARPDETPIERAIRERDEMKANWQRARADYQNLKRRQLSDTSAEVHRRRAELLQEFLVVLDYLDMALMTETTSEDAKNLMVGIEMTRQQFQSVIERLGVKPVPTTGSFDPALHQAMATVDDEEQPAGTILEVSRTGWMLEDQVLRHAQVKVVAAPASAEEEPETEEPAEVEAEVIEPGEDEPARDSEEADG